ncbi:hypothetical protein HJC22_32040 [Corallococcus exiguus]|uniref:hypothetical protein n=1 Tax=Corallococcus exiguus TaxID=83462 RepID=UPI00147236A1|nr:hypothetical protein [Corallococcus exiguus]NNC20362.1 hypothetical protein [Corallococcus exiguus]
MSVKRRRSKLSCLLIIGEKSLLGLLGKGDRRELAFAKALPLLQNLNLLEILYIERIVSKLPRSACSFESALKLKIGIIDS